LNKKTQNIRCHLNFTSTLERTKKKLNSCLQRNVSFQGRIPLSKAEGMPRPTYAAISSDVDKRTCEDSEQMLCNFIWKNKAHYNKTKTSVFINSYERSCLSLFPDYQRGDFGILDWHKLSF